jgi:uncharacterized membrane protein YidH (DUF202 family)
MQKERHHATIDEAKRATEYLANERTFLAWIRTSVAVVSLGFVVARFSVWLQELSGDLSRRMEGHRVGISLPVGVVMMILGDTTFWSNDRFYPPDRGAPVSATMPPFLSRFWIITFSL